MTPNDKRPIMIAQRQFAQSAPGLRSVDLFHGEEFALEPYLVFTEFRMDRGIFGPHPHAGMSVLTYMFADSPGAFINRDSLGDRSRIEPGGAHLTQAGSGILHDEVPEHVGTTCHGMQIWINHAAAHRMVEPAAMHASAAEIPEIAAPGQTVRVVLGQFGGRSSPITPVTKVQLLEVTLAPTTSIVVSVEPSCFVYVVRGVAQVSEDAPPAAKRSLVLYDELGSTVELRGGDEGVTLLLASGTPHREPIVHGGPFVGSSQEQVNEMRRRFSAGAMGTLSAV